MISVIVMTVIGKSSHWRMACDELFPAPPGYCWQIVPEGPPAAQFRSILRMDARAVAVWVGADGAVDRAAKLISRLLETGPPIVIAIAESHDPLRESVLRQTGALYLCANEAHERMGEVLESVLSLPCRAGDVRTAPFSPVVKINTS